MASFMDTASNSRGKVNHDSIKAATTQCKVVNTSDNPAPISDALYTLRSLGRKKRATLGYGPVVELREHTGLKVLAEMPLRLFDVISGKKDNMQEINGTQRICVPEIFLHVSVKELIARVNMFTDPAIDIKPMESTGNLFKDLHMASTADFLGLSAYTQRMLNMHWQRLNTSVPTLTDVTLIGKVNTPLGDKLFEMVSYNLATLYREGKIPNAAAFEAFLAGDASLNVRLNTAVQKCLNKWEAIHATLRARENIHRGRVEQQWKAKKYNRKLAMEEIE